MKTLRLCRLLLIALIVAHPSFALAQTPHYPTLEELLPGGTKFRHPQTLYGLQWWGEVCIEPTDKAVKGIDLSTGKDQTLFTLQEVNEALTARSLPTLNHLYSLSFPRGEHREAVFRVANHYVTYDFGRKEISSVQSLQEGGEHVDRCPATGQVAYTVKNNLFVGERPITDEPAGVVCGQSVHRSEFGISKGTYWSPKGHLLAFYRMDERMVQSYPLDNPRSIEPKWVRYPAAGQTSHQVQVGLYDVRTQRTVYLETGDPTDRYFTNIAWSPDEQSLYLIELNRDQNHSKLCRYDVATGKLLAVLYEEFHPKYVEPQHPIVFLPWNDRQFVYQSQRDGYNHIYIGSLDKATDGSTQEAAGGGRYRAQIEMKQLTRGNWLVKDLLGFDKEQKTVLFTAIEGVRSGRMAVDLKGRMDRPFSSLDICDYQAVASPSGRGVIETISSPTTPRRILLTDTKKKQTKTLLDAANPYEGCIMPSIETGTLTAADGTTPLHYRIIKPAGLDATKKHPAIVYVYGGPHAQLVTGGYQYGARGWELYMANKGYIVFVLDGRGSSNRGLAFENATFRNLGIEEGKDQLCGVDFLKSLPYVDKDRIGVHGWSFGGHMTTALMLRHPEVFKVGVAGGPVISWDYYEVMYGERYMDTPASNPEGYANGDLRRLANRLKGRLMIIHDTLDDTCLPQQTMSFIEECIKQRTYPDLFLYPGHGHNVLGRDRVHLYENITRYFENHL